MEILVGLMHAAQAAHGDHYDIYDAHEPFADIHHDPPALKPKAQPQGPIGVVAVL